MNGFWFIITASQLSEEMEKKKGGRHKYFAAEMEPWTNHLFVQLELSQCDWKGKELSKGKGLLISLTKILEHNVMQQAKGTGKWRLLTHSKGEKHDGTTSAAKKAH